MKQQLVSVLLITLGALTAGVGCQTGDDGSTRAPQPVPAQSFASEWSVQLDINERAPLTEMHVRDEAIFLYSRDYFAHVVNRASGDLMHYNRIAPSAIRLFPPVVLPDRVVYPTNAALMMYNLRGRHMNTVQLDYSLRSPAIGAKDRIYAGTTAGSSGGRVAAINVTRDYAHTRWELLTSGPVSAAPALFNNVLYIGSEDGRLYAVSATDREPHWSLEGSAFPTFGKIVADVQADEFGVYVASSDSKLYCVARDTGKLKWQYFAGASLEASPAVTASTIYQSIPRRGVAAINKTEGEFNRQPLWVVSDAVQFLADDDRYAYLRRRDNTIIAVDRNTGDVAFTSKRADFDVFGTNLRSDGLVYAATSRGQVMAIRPVLRPGQMGELVLVPTPLQSVALAE